jgi:polysaccharide chain length determinant protein (PEP-CTERM system associated)
MEALVRQIITELRGAWRYRWPAIGLAWLASLIGWAAVFALPNQYEATAKVFVDTDSAIRPFLQGIAVEADVATRVGYVRQRLLSRPNLEQVARSTDLDLRVTSPEDFEKLLLRLRQDIQISSESSALGYGRSGQPDVYTIAFRDPERDTAEDVVQNLLNTFIEASMGGVGEDPQTAQAFLEDQIKLYAERLDEAERKLADFKREHVGMVVPDGGDYFARLQGEIAELDALRNELQVAIQKRNALMRQMQGTAPVTGEALTPRTALEQRIVEQEARVDELLLAYTEKHPDVIAARETVTALKRQLAELNDDPSLRAGASNPVFQQAQIALNDAEVEIAALRSRLATRERRVQELRDMLNTMPDVEAELQALTRDYDITRSRYEQLVQSLDNATISGAVGQTGEDLSFRVIEPPLAGLEPVAPNRALLLLGVLAAALAAGGALAFVLHQFNPVFTTREQVYQELELPVLGSVSMAWTPAQLRAQKLSHWSYGLALTTLLAVFAGVFVSRDWLIAQVQSLLA